MMMIKPTSAMLAIATAAALAAPALHAQDAGWYAGGAIGRAGATIDDERIRGGLAGQGLSTSSIEDREHDTGYKLFGGYQFNRHLAVEGGYFDLGNFGYTARATPTGSLSGDLGVKGLNLDLVGTLPLTDRFSLLARAGVINARSQGSFSATGAARVPYASANSSERFTGAKWGVGVAYAVTEAVSMRLEAERFRIKDSVGNRGHVDLVSVGLVYRFGASTPRSVPAAAALPTPAPVAVVAPAPLVAAAPVPPPAPVVVARVNLSADSLFDFDSAAVKPQGRTALDKLAADLRGMQYESIRVTGHTDRLGSTAYNAALSSRRAAAVTEYLTQAGSMGRGPVTTTGAGEAEPVTAAGTCRGTSPTPALVACLQLDRRVEVVVNGAR